MPPGLLASPGRRLLAHPSPVYHSGSGASSPPPGSSSISSSFSIWTAWKSIGGMGIRLTALLLLVESSMPFTLQYLSYHSLTIAGLTKPCRRLATDGTSSPFSNSSFAVMRRMRFRLVAPFVLTGCLGLGGMIGLMVSTHPGCKPRYS